MKRLFELIYGGLISIWYLHDYIKIDYFNFCIYFADNEEFDKRLWSAIRNINVDESQNLTSN